MNLPGIKLPLFYLLNYPQGFILQINAYSGPDKPCLPNQILTLIEFDGSDRGSCNYDAPLPTTARQGNTIFSISTWPLSRATTVGPSHYNKNNATQGNSRETHLLVQKTIECKNQTNDAVEIGIKCDTIYGPRNPLQMYTGFHDPTQLHVPMHIALQQSQCTNALHIALQIFRTNT